MVTFETRISVKGKTRFQIIRFLNRLDRDNYLSWHREHVDFQWMEKTRGLKGSRLFISENIGGLKLKNVWSVVEVMESSRIVLKAERRVPLFFEIELGDDQNGTLVLHRISFGFEGLWGRIVNPLLTLFVGLVIMRSYRRHTVEEYLRLEELC